MAAMRTQVPSPAYSSAGIVRKFTRTTNNTTGKAIRNDEWVCGFIFNDCAHPRSAAVRTPDGSRWSARSSLVGSRPSLITKLIFPENLGYESEDPVANESISIAFLSHVVFQLFRVAGD